MLYKILTDRFAEFDLGDVVGIDDKAAQIALEKGEIEPVKEEEKEVAEFECEICGKVCKNKVGLLAHKRSHK